jgi:hypothetical protein
MPTSNRAFAGCGKLDTKLFKVIQCGCANAFVSDLIV